MASQGLGNPRNNKEGELEKSSASECVEFTESEVVREDRAKAVGNFAAGFFSLGSTFFPFKETNSSYQRYCLVFEMPLLAGVSLDPYIGTVNFGWFLIRIHEALELVARGAPPP